MRVLTHSEQRSDECGTVFIQVGSGSAESLKYVPLDMWLVWVYLNTFIDSIVFLCFCFFPQLEISKAITVVKMV